MKETPTKRERLPANGIIQLSRIKELVGILDLSTENLSSATGISEERWQEMLAIPTTTGSDTRVTFIEELAISTVFTMLQKSYQLSISSCLALVIAGTNFNTKEKKKILDFLKGFFDREGD